MMRLAIFRRRLRDLATGIRKRVAGLAHSDPLGITATTVARSTTEQFAETLLMRPRYDDPRSLAHFELRAFSQNGEDGMLSEILRRIGATDRRFVEIGVSEGIETNTTLLLLLGWRGVWIDGDSEALARARQTFREFTASGRLRIEQQFITAENVAEVLEAAEVPREFDVLSLDIDRNTYYTWEALSDYRPRVVVVEYNASFPPSVDWKVEYQAAKVWNETIYFGASLKAYENLARRFGYSLVGCTLSGTNAFFVRDDLRGDHFLPDCSAEFHYEPPRYWLSWRFGHKRGIEAVTDDGVPPAGRQLLEASS